MFQKATLGLLVGDVLEVPVVGDVADRPHAVGGGAHVLVDDDRAVVVELDPAPLGVEQVAVRLAAGRHQQLVDLDLVLVAVDHDPARAALDPVGQLARVQVDALGEQFGEALARSRRPASQHQSASG